MPELPRHALTTLHQEFERALYLLTFWVQRPTRAEDVATALERVAAEIRKGT